MLPIINFIIMLLFFSLESQAQVIFNNLSHRGTGCPQGTVAMSPSPDRTSVSFLFDAFSVSVPQTRGENDNEESDRRLRRFDRNFEHKACALSFSAEVPEGEHVDSIEIQIFNRGAAILDPGINGTISTVFVGHNGHGNNGNGNGHARGRERIVLERKIWNANNNGINEDWISNPTMLVPIRSNCSRRNQKMIRFDLRSHIEAEIGRRHTGGTGLITMDSSDINGNLKIKLITRPCGGRMSPR